MISRVILDISTPQENTTLMKEENFAIEDIYISIEDFKNFLYYLDTVYIGKISPDGKAEINDNVVFKLGSYKLCFVGNYPGKEILFQGRKKAKEHYGIDAPFYSVDYAIHSSISAGSYPQLDLTGAKIPLRNASEAINYFWGTKYEQHSINNYCSIYMPTFEASINSVTFKENTLDLKIDFDEKRVKLDDLSVGIIAENKSQEFRQKFPIDKKQINVDFKFIPDQVSIFLYYKSKKLDELNHYDYKPENTPRISKRFSYGNESILEPSFVQGTVEELLDQDLVAKLPSQMQKLLLESEHAFNEGLHRAAVLLFRSAIEEGITILLKQIGKENEMYPDKFEVGLGRKIKLITDYIPSLNQVRSELNDVKWFGDKASHEANMAINESDVTTNLEPKLRLILTKFVEEIKITKS
ncbi:MAG: hypothetical protein KGI28_02345 [Thaumarchaeota archaeon]|nr:hypothetical protein [Nitrososphaerota archaeon]